MSNFNKLNKLTINANNIKYTPYLINNPGNGDCFFYTIYMALNGINKSMTKKNFEKLNEDKIITSTIDEYRTIMVRNFLKNSQNNNSKFALIGTVNNINEKKRFEEWMKTQNLKNITNNEKFILYMKSSSYLPDQPTIRSFLNNITVEKNNNNDKYTILNPKNNETKPNKKKLNVITFVKNDNGIFIIQDSIEIKNDTLYIIIILENIHYQLVGFKKNTGNNVNVNNQLIFDGGNNDDKIFLEKISPQKSAVAEPSIQTTRNNIEKAKKNNIEKAIKIFNKLKENQTNNNIKKFLTDIIQNLNEKKPENITSQYLQKKMNEFQTFTQNLKNKELQNLKNKELQNIAQEPAQKPATINNILSIHFNNKNINNKNIDSIFNRLKEHITFNNSSNKNGIIQNKDKLYFRKFILYLFRKKKLTKIDSRLLCNLIKLLDVSKNTSIIYFIIDLLYYVKKSPNNSSNNSSNNYNSVIDCIKESAENKKNNNISNYIGKYNT